MLTKLHVRHVFSAALMTLVSPVANVRNILFPCTLLSITVELRLTATSVIRSPRYNGHFFSTRQNGHSFPYDKSPLMRSAIITAICLKFRKLKCLWHVNFIDLVIWAYSCTVLDYSTHKEHLLRFYSRILSVLFAEGKSYAISSFQLFINENSCSRNANAVYATFVIMALKSWNLSLPRWYRYQVNTAKIFWPICDLINGVPLYKQHNRQHTNCLNLIHFTTSDYFTSLC